MGCVRWWQGLGKGFGQGFGQDGLAEARAAIQGLQARLDNTACIKGSRALEAHLSALWRAVDAQVSCTDKLQAAEHHFDAHWGQAKVDLAAAKAELPELAAKVQGVQEQLPGMLAELKALRGDLGGAPALEWEEVQRKVGEAVAREVQRAERRAAQQLARSEEGVRAELADLARQLAAPGAARAESRAAQLANREDDVRRELEDLARQLAAAEARAAEARGKALNIVGASGVNYSCSGAADLRARHEEAVVGHLVSAPLHGQGCCSGVTALRNATLIVRVHMCMDVTLCGAPNLQLFHACCGVRCPRQLSGVALSVAALEQQRSGVALTFNLCALCCAEGHGARAPRAAPRVCRVQGGARTSPLLSDLKSRGAGLHTHNIIGDRVPRYNPWITLLLMKSGRKLDLAKH